MARRWAAHRAEPRTAQSRALTGWQRRGHCLDQSAVGHDVHQGALEAQSDALTDQRRLQQHLVTAESDAAVAGNGARDLDHRAGGQRLDGGGPACRLGSRDACTAPQQIAQVVFG